MVLAALLELVEQQEVALAALVFWGAVVAGDSPQFSTLNARTAPRELVGTALTLVTSVGFLITVPSIQLLDVLTRTLGPETSLLALAPGPLLALAALRPLTRAART